MNKIYVLDTDSKEDSLTGPLCPPNSPHMPQASWGVSVPPRGPWAMSAVIPGCHNGWRVPLVEIRDAAKHSTVCRTAPQTEVPSPNGSNAQVEKSCLIEHLQCAELHKTLQGDEITGVRFSCPRSHNNCRAEEGPGSN